MNDVGRISSFMLGLLLGACTPSADGSSDTGSDDSGTGSGSGTASSTSAMTTASMTSAATESDGDSTGSATSSMTSPGDTTTGGEVGSSGGSVESPYPACGMDGSCPDPFTVCAEIGGGSNPDGSWCTIPCMDDAECPAPDSDVLEAVCQILPAPGGGGDSVCILGCGNGGQCPTGMECIGGICMYPN